MGKGRESKRETLNGSLVLLPVVPGRRQDPSLYTHLVSTAVDRSPPGGLDSVKAALSHGKYFLPEHFWLTLGTNTRGSDSRATVTSSTNGTEAAEGQEGLRTQSRLSVVMLSMGCLVCSSGHPDVCRGESLGACRQQHGAWRMVAAVSAHAGPAPRGRAGPITTFSLILIRLMDGQRC